MTARTVLSMEQSRGTAGAVRACIEDQGYATGLVALAVLAELNSPQRGKGRPPAHPLLQSTRVTPEGLHRYAAVRNEFPFPDQADETLGLHMDNLRRVVLERWPGSVARDQSVPEPRLRHGDMLFDVVRVKEWPDPRAWRASRVSWLIRGGQWAYWTMNRNGRILLCRIAAACLSHAQPERVSYTMKLGWHLGFSTLLLGGNEPLEVPVADLLRDTGILPGGRAGQPDGLPPSYLGFSHALASLCEAGVLADVVWPTARRSLAAHGARRIPDGWMESTVRLAPAAIPAPPAEQAMPGQLEILNS